ncbi:hypothetical protein HDK90DRAFT_465327 [Phyllosticta capitalensis]|uniref:Uncharacterized protein n=1 Tax=Phyllosticta capitalensis TaxID=121624 RepID=A0ABR1YU73_9PEZI
MPLSAANQIAVVSVVGVYIGIVISLYQMWKQREPLLTEADLENGSNTDEEVHELHSDLDLSETLEHQSTGSAQTTDFALDLDPSKSRRQQSSFASTTTLTAHAGHCSSSPSPGAAFDFDSPSSRPCLVRGTSAPLFLD